MISSFLGSYKICYTQVFPEFCPMLNSKEIGLCFEYCNLEHFLYIEIILLVLKIEKNSLEEKAWLKRLASWSDISLFNRLRT